MRTCELLCVGTELLLGDILNTNAQFLAQQLAQNGFAVYHQSTVGDNPGRLRDAMALALSRSDVVLCTGGLGPTQDDITRETASELLRLPLEDDAQAEKEIAAFFKARGTSMSQNNLRQAKKPQGATVFYNQNGTAPGLAMQTDAHKTLILLPGPPRELQPMFLQQVLPYLQPLTDGVIVSHQVHTIGIGESTMAEKVADLLAGTNPTLAPYAKNAEAYLRVSAHAQTREAAERLCEPVIAKVCERLGNDVYGIDVASVEQAVVSLLAAQGKTVATAESCTGGGLASRITDIPGASQVFHGALVTYTNEQKQRLLGVEAQTLNTYGAVSSQTAVAMAKGALRVCGTDFALSTTGYAGPAAPNEPAGESYIALATAQNTYVQHLVTGRGDRAFNRYYTASRALDLLRRVLCGFSVPA